MAFMAPAMSLVAAPFRSVGVTKGALRSSLRSCSFLTTALFMTFDLFKLMNHRWDPGREREVAGLAMYRQTSGAVGRRERGGGHSRFAISPDLNGTWEECASIEWDLLGLERT